MKVSYELVIQLKFPSMRNKSILQLKTVLNPINTSKLLKQCFIKQFNLPATYLAFYGLVLVQFQLTSESLNLSLSYTKLIILYLWTIKN